MNNRRIQIFTKEGVFKRQFKIPTHEEIVEDPRSFNVLAIFSQGESERSEHERGESEANPSRQRGGSETTPSRQRGEIYVIMTGLMYIFDLEGKLLRKSHQTGGGLAIWQERIYTVDRHNFLINVYEKEYC
jgi:hypothetical protein